MDERLLELASLFALAGLCASPHHPAGAHPTNGDANKVAARAEALGEALAVRLAARRPAREDSPSAEIDSLRRELDELRRQLAASRAAPPTDPAEPPAPADLQAEAPEAKPKKR